MNEKAITKSLSTVELSIRTVKPRSAGIGANGTRTEQPEGARVVVVTSW
jgi:hypothetical protein